MDRDVTTKQAATIAAYVRQGAYPHMAAEAAGVPGPAFERWQARAARDGATPQQRRLLRSIHQAEAQARVLAEVKVFADDPKMWLRSGPGRELPRSPGWTTSAKQHPPREGSVNRLADGGWNELWGVILEALAAFPEARTALGEALRELPAVVEVTG